MSGFDWSCSSGISATGSSSSMLGRGGRSSMITRSAWGVPGGSGTLRRASLRPVARFMRTCRPGGIDWSSWMRWKCSVGWKIAG